MSIFFMKTGVRQTNESLSYPNIYYRTYINAMKNSDKQNARMESERALQSVIFSIMADNMELFKQFNDNPSFKKWLSDLVFNLTYNPEGKPFETPSNDSNNK